MQTRSCSCWRDVQGLADLGAVQPFPARQDQQIPIGGRQFDNRSKHPCRINLSVETTSDPLGHTQQRIDTVGIHRARALQSKQSPALGSPMAPQQICRDPEQPTPLTPAGCVEGRIRLDRCAEGLGQQVLGKLSSDTPSEIREEPSGVFVVQRTHGIGHGSTSDLLNVAQPHTRYLPAATQVLRSPHYPVAHTGDLEVPIASEPTAPSRPFEVAGRALRNGCR